jgi:hypothetical protein
MSEREEEADSGFRVTDRRGRARDAVSEGPPAQPSPLVMPSAPAAPAAPGPALAGDLRGLFVMLGESALASLGDPADPLGQGGDLEQARDLVEMLLVLRERTEGRLTDEESRLLEQVLYELQGQFARAAGGPRTARPGNR